MLSVLFSVSNRSYPWFMTILKNRYCICTFVRGWHSVCACWTAQDRDAVGWGSVSLRSLQRCPDSHGHWLRYDRAQALLSLRNLLGYHHTLSQAAPTNTSLLSFPVLAQELLFPQFFQVTPAIVSCYLRQKCCLPAGNCWKQGGLLWKCWHNFIYSIAVWTICFQ